MCNCKIDSLFHKIKVKIKKLVPEATIPRYAKYGDAGMDLVATSVRETRDFIEYGTGLAFEIPTGYVGLLFPRSSNSKKDLLMCNSVGVVDSGYRGEVSLRFKVTGDPNQSTNYKQIYSVGDAAGQIVIIPIPFVEFEESDELEPSERGVGAYGHSGN